MALNQGDGTFAEVQLSGFGKDPNWAEAIRLAVGDINGDGKADAVGVSNSAGLPAFALSNGDGTFAAGVAFTRGTTAEGGGVPLIVDIDGDSRNDIVVPPRSWHNAGKGKLISENLYDKNYRRDGVAVADFDGDGSVDLATSGNGDGILLWKSNGNGTFATEPVKFADPQIAGHIVAGDFNGDGKPDIAAPGESISILTNQGDGNFSGPSYLQLNGIGGADRVNELVAADLNGDKLVDLAAITWASYGKGENVVVFMNNGKGKFAAPLLVPSGRPTQLAAGVIGPEGVMSLVAVEPVMQGNDSKSTIYIMRATCR